jgi:hypothetical protein
VFSKVLIIKFFFSSGKSFSFKNALIFLTIISQSVFHFSLDDFKSDFSSGVTLFSIQSVAIIDAATR